jgi:predicted anti-sigma-YlaC factor YlaD
MNDRGTCAAARRALLERALRGSDEGQGIAEADTHARACPACSDWRERLRVAPPLLGPARLYTPALRARTLSAVAAEAGAVRERPLRWIVPASLAGLAYSTVPVAVVARFIGTLVESSLVSVGLAVAVVGSFTLASTAVVLGVLVRAKKLGISAGDPPGSLAEA